MKRTVKRRSVLKKQTVKRKKKRNFFALFNALHLVGSGFLKIVILLVVTVTISLSFLFLYQYLLTSPYMKLQHVEMEGVDRKERQKIIRLCGLSSDLSLLGIKLNDLKKKIETHPWIRTAQLERNFPHTLTIRVEKQAPSALVLMDKMYYMNQHGEIFKEVQEWEDMDMPLITGISKKGMNNPARLSRAAAVLSILTPENGLWALDELSEIHFKEDDGISLYFNHLAAEIRLEGHDFKGKMAGLKKVAEHLIRTGQIHQVEGIDLNYMDGAVVSFRKS